MTPSFSFDEQRLFFALAPSFIQSAMKKHAVSPERFVEFHEADLKKVGLRTKNILAWQQHKRTCDPRKILADCERLGIQLVYQQECEALQRLEHLGKQAPQVIFLRGQIPDVPWIAVIGTREPTPYGERVTDQLIRDFQGSSIGIISGLALGTDGRAHTQALEHHLPTLAVLASGLGDADIYPRRHEYLARRIIAEGGGLISELPPGGAIHEGAFPARNRLIAALCRAVIVTEARERSGTLITARIALELGREVLAVPGSIFSEASAGTHTLIAAGAHVCRTTQDVWHALAVDPPTKAEQTRRSMQISPQDKQVFELITQSDEGCLSDVIAEALSISANTLGARLGLLELQGLIRQAPNGRWILCGLA